MDNMNNIGSGRLIVIIIIVLLLFGIIGGCSDRRIESSSMPSASHNPEQFTGDDGYDPFGDDYSSSSAVLTP